MFPNSKKISYPYLSKAFKNTIIKNVAGYPYPISPFAGVTQAINPEMLAEVAQFVQAEKLFSQANLIVTFDSAGTQLAAIVGQALNLPYLIAKKRKFDLPGEISFSVKTNFDEKIFYLYGNFKNKKILLIDDIISSGSTQKAANLALNKSGAKVIALFAVASKTNIIGKRYQDNLKDLQMPLITIMEIQIVNEKVAVNYQDTSSN